jgi:dihydrofolate synthase/folylpolyglutamate synthase
LAEASLDYAVMEIGLGGRLDAVNLLDADVAVITPIGLDHQEYLGSDLESIGREKAGIIRPRQRLICGEPDPPASVLAIAAEQGARLQRRGVEFRVNVDGDAVRYTADGLDLNLPPPALPGPHQLDNMATGLAAVLAMIPEAADDRAALARGLRAVRLPGRLERIAERPALWFDVGHNPLGARAVATALSGIMAAEGIESCRCVIGMLADKDAAAAVAELQPVISHWYCASLPGSRGQAAEQLAAKIAAAAGNSPLQVFDSVKAALKAALADAGPKDGVLVFGSFLTVAEAGNSGLGRELPEPAGPVATSRGGY